MGEKLACANALAEYKKPKVTAIWENCAIFIDFSEPCSKNTFSQRVTWVFHLALALAPATS
jgi:hypothetical protein